MKAQTLLMQRDAAIDRRLPAIMCSAQLCVVAQVGRTGSRMNASFSACEVPVRWT